MANGSSDLVSQNNYSIVTDLAMKTAENWGQTTVFGSA